MTAYIEYVFLENFILDGLLLFGAHRFTKTPVRYGRLCLSASLGGIYALCSPFIRLPVWCNWLLKFCVGAVLCLCASGRLKNKKQWGRYAFFLFGFLVFTFMVAGFLLSVWNTLPEKPPFLLVLLCVALGVGIVETFFAVHRRKRRLYTYIFDCQVFGKTLVKTRGYLDSGNVAKKDDIPICFISALLFYEAFSYDATAEKTEIITVAGVKEVLVYKGELTVGLQGGKWCGEVYNRLR